MSDQNKEKQNTILKKEVYNLVDGDFQYDDALEIINDLFFGKINFHTRKNFSKQIRYGSEDLLGLRRIEQLKIARNMAMKLIDISKKNGKSLRLKSTISIELI